MLLFARLDFHILHFPYNILFSSSVIVHLASSHFAFHKCKHTHSQSCAIPASAYRWDRSSTIPHSLTWSVPSPNRWWIFQPIPKLWLPVNRSTMTQQNCRTPQIWPLAIDSTLADEMVTDDAVNFAIRNRRAWVNYSFCDRCQFRRFSHHHRRRHSSSHCGRSVRLYFVTSHSVGFVERPGSPRTCNNDKS